MDPRLFSDGAMLKHGWRQMQSHLGVLIGAMFLALIISLIPLVIGGMIQNGDAAAIVSIVMFLLYVVLIIYFSIGLIRMTIAASDEQPVTISMLFSGHDVLLPYFGVSVLYGLIVVVGYFLLIFPGIIWGLKYMFAPILVIDQKLGPMEALRKSAEMTHGFKWDMLGFASVMQVVNVIGMLALYIGLVVSVPTTLISFARLYRHMVGAAGKPAAAGKAKM